MIKHFDWVHPDNIVVTNKYKSNDPSYIKIHEDLKGSDAKVRFFSLELDGDVKYFLTYPLGKSFFLYQLCDTTLSNWMGDKPRPRDGVYYTEAYLIDKSLILIFGTTQVLGEDLIMMWKQFIREEKLNELGI